MKTITIDVTQGDINDGLPCSSSNCPIAIAFRRIFSKHWICVSANGWRMGLKSHPPEFSGTVPLAVSRFIRDFDCLGDDGVGPFSFTIEVPEELLTSVD